MAFSNGFRRNIPVSEVECGDAVREGTSNYLALFDDGNLEINHSNGHEAARRASYLLDLLERLNFFIDKSLSSPSTLARLMALRSELEETINFHGGLVKAFQSSRTPVCATAVVATEDIADVPLPVIEIVEDVDRHHDNLFGYIDDNSDDDGCPICFNNEGVILLEVSHRCHHVFCEDCIQHYLRNALDTGKALSIRCPQPGCPEEIPFDVVSQLMDPEWCSHYEELAVKALMRTDANCKWCPRPGCETPVIVEGDVENVTCPGCQFKYCPKCLLESHPKVTCANFAQWKTDNKSADSKFDEWVLHHSVKKCPKCKMFTEKNKVGFTSFVVYILWSLITNDHPYI